MTKDKIGEMVRLAMAKKNINNKVLGKILGCTAQTVSVYRSGECSNIIVLSKIATACNLTLTEMILLVEPL